MTEIKSAIKQIQTEMIKDIDIPKSAKTELANQKALRLAIRSLEAWSEVLEELEKKNALYMSYLSNKENPFDSDLFGKHIAVDNCIDIINQHLSEIKTIEIINQKLADVPDTNVGEIKERN